MANDIMDMLRKQALDSLQEAIGGQQQKSSNGGGGSGKGILAGAALAAAAPMAARGIQAYRNGQVGDFVSKLGSGEALEDVRSRFDGGGTSNGNGRSDDDEQEPEARQDEDEQAEADADADADGADGDDEREPGDGTLAIGKGRRMPVQQSVDVAVPLETAYNQFTQFEDWPQFMHRVTNVSQDDDETVKFTTKIWTRTREFEAKILTQRPNDRIMWNVAQGITHSGVVSFHELAPRLTRIEVTVDIKPGSLIEKAARGMRHIKRAIRADLHRYKAFIEMQDLETGAWRGVIEDGEVVEEHDESYDEEREYSDVEDLQEQFGSGSGDDDEDESDDEQQEDDEPAKRERPRERARRRTPAAA